MFAKAIFWLFYEKSKKIVSYDDDVIYTFIDRVYRKLIAEIKRLTFVLSYIIKAKYLIFRSLSRIRATTLRSKYELSVPFFIRRILGLDA